MSSTIVTVNGIELVAGTDFDNADAFNRLFASGGEVILPEGVYSTGPIDISNPVSLVLSKGAVIRFIPDFSLYKPVFTRWEGVKCYCMHPCLYIHDTGNVHVSGEGVIDGNGEAWWKTALAKKGIQTEPLSDIERMFASLNPDYRKQAEGGGGRIFQFLRPPLVQLRNVHDASLEGITLKDSPFWTLHPLFCEGLYLRELNIYNPAAAPNTDGIDIESSHNVHVEKCNIFVGDDGIAIKSGSGPDGIADGAASYDIHISSCHVKAAHGGAVIGSETAAPIYDVHVKDCLFEGTDRGIRIKTRRGRGGSIHDLEFSGIRMTDNFCPLVINTYYRCGSQDMKLFSLERQPVDDTTPRIFNISVSDCVATGCRAATGFIVGLPEAPIENLAISDCSFFLEDEPSVPVEESDMYLGLPAPASRGIRLRNIKGLTLENVISDGASPGFIYEEEVK